MTILGNLELQSLEICSNIYRVTAEEPRCNYPLNHCEFKAYIFPFNLEHLKSLNVFYILGKRKQVNSIFPLSP